MRTLSGRLTPGRTQGEMALRHSLKRAARRSSEGASGGFSQGMVFQPAASARRRTSRSSKSAPNTSSRVISRTTRATRPTRIFLASRSMTSASSMATSNQAKGRWAPSPKEVARSAVGETW
jgi:hypothetical protein